MPIRIKDIEVQNKKAMGRYTAAERKKRFPAFTHRKDRPLTLPKLHCRITRLEPDSSSGVRVHAEVTNVGSGPSSHTKVQFHYAALPLIALRRVDDDQPRAHDPPPDPPPAPPDPGELMELEAEEATTIEPGETRGFTCLLQQLPTFQNWQVAVLAFDPMADPLPMERWHTLMQPLRNLLKYPDNPPTDRKIPYWKEYADPDADDDDHIPYDETTWRGRSAAPAPVMRTGFLGTALSNPTYFAPYDAGPVSELRQKVGVTSLESLIDTGDLGFRLSGFVRSYDQGTAPPDTSQMILQCRHGSTVLAELDLGIHDNVDTWRLVSGQVLAPRETTNVQVRLRSRRRTGDNNDGYYDVLCLTPTHRQISTLDRGAVG